MPKIEYVPKKFNASSKRLIQQANTIIQEYEVAGYDLTLRQLYYQFVARDIIPNNMKSYKRLGAVINDARLAGLIDWNTITDRTRNLQRLSHWDDPADIVRSCHYSYREDKWDAQPTYVEVWIEKEALSGVFNRVCEELDLPMFACRGYVSQSEMWAAGRRLEIKRDGGKEVIVLHFGDHDPSGLDMSRDIEERLALFMGGASIRRLALNMDQIEEYSPPPNPAKTTDSRYAGYIRSYGTQSWELDALNPDTLAGLVRAEVEQVIDKSAWQRSLRREQKNKSLLERASDNWDNVTEFLDSI